MNWTPPTGTLALIFDCDGTLADTMPIHYRAWLTMLNRHGLSFPETRFYALGGVPSGKIVRLLAEEQGVVLADVEAMIHEKEAAFLAMASEVRPVQPVLAVAHEQRGKLPMAVASGGYRDIVHRTLHGIEIFDWFDAIVCAEDTEHHKPEPDVFLEAARRLGIDDPARCVVFEDTDIGMEAARRAGMFGVDVRDWR